MKLCFVTPWPPHEGGVALHSYELVGHLVTLYPHLAITVVTVCDNPMPLPSVNVIGVGSRLDLPDFTEFDHVIHVLTNHIYTNISFDLLKEIGGAILMHERNIHQRLIVNAELCEMGFKWDSYKYLDRQKSNSKQKRVWHLLKAMVNEYGIKWVFKHLRIKTSLAKTRCDIATKAHYMDYVTTYADRVICLSEFSEKAIAAIAGIEPEKVSHIRFGFNPRSSTPSQRKKEFVFGLFGTEGAMKHYNTVLKSFQMLCKMHPAAPFRLHVVGSISDTTLRIIKRLDLLDKVRVVYKPCHERWNTELAKIDTLISLRYPTVGEASGPVCQAAQLGIRSIVNNVGWFASLPEWLVYKTPTPVYMVSLIDAMQRAYMEGDTKKIEEEKEQVLTKAREYFSMEKSAEEFVTQMGLVHPTSKVELACAGVCK